MSLGEDQNLIHQGQGPTVMALLRDAAISLLVAALPTAAAVALLVAGLPDAAAVALLVVGLPTDA